MLWGERQGRGTFGAVLPKELFHATATLSFSYERTEAFWGGPDIFFKTETWSPADRRLLFGATLILLLI
jgi:hypothetical protein